MFKLDPSPTFEARVAGFVPGRPNDGLIASYRHQTIEQFQSWLVTMAEKTIEDAVMDIVSGWRDAPRDFSREALADIAKSYPAFVPALIETYRRELFEARTKN